MLRAAITVLSVACIVVVAGCAPPGDGRAGVRRATPAATVDAAGCGDPAIALHVVQGDGTRSGLAGEAVEVEGVVTHAFAGLGGFFIEAPAGQRDHDPATAEGLFVQAAPGLATPAPGAHVRIAGTIDEIGRDGATVTTLVASRAWPDCGGDATLPPPVAITAPLSDAAREALEGMRVVIPGPATLTDTYAMTTRATVRVALGDRLFVPTEKARPGPDIAALALANGRREFMLDGSRTESFAPLWFLPRAPDAGAPWRTGTRLSDIAGIVDQCDGAYRVQLTAPLATNEQAPRPAPPRVDGRTTIASFNVFNFFNGDGAGGGFPTARGAADAMSLARQRDKIARAIGAIRPDVAALMEVENDGYGDTSALAELTRAINRETGGAATYAFIDPRVDRVGGDLVTVALIYRVGRAQPQGAAAIVDLPAFRTKNRMPIAQRFVASDGGKPFVVVANHFKSKSCGDDATGADADTKDGQGCWNATRTAAARALATWLDAAPIARGHDVLVVGDLNAHGQEDPVQALREAGYVDVVDRALGDGAYSFVFDGRAGRLDHALANAGMARRVVDADEWHANADELAVFDFTVDGKSPSQRAAGEASPYRASDHDPLVVGIDR